MKKLFLFLTFFVLTSFVFGQQYLNNNKFYVSADGDIDSVRILTAESVVENDPYGYNAAFQLAYTIPLTEDTYAHITNADNTLWTLLCANGWSETNDTLTCSMSGSYGGTFAIRGSGGANEDYQVRLYDVTAAAEVAYCWLPFSTTGANNYAGGTMPLCFVGVSGHKYVFEIQNTTDNDDYTTILGVVWFKLMKS